MKSDDSSEWLSAADCASRTGLTVRALRVYEECGLITPRRSASGWRQYGPRDLAKLGTISLLKTAGLSLEQIRDVTSGSASEPTLQHILAIQLATWKRKRAEAEGGQAITQVALRRLRYGQSLSVDELCKLIRSLETTQSQAGATDVAWATVDASVLDGYAGLYRGLEYGVMRIWREGQKLLTDAQIPGSSGVTELHPLSETDFYPTNCAGYLQYTFLRDSQGTVSAVRMRVQAVQGVEYLFPRVDVTTAEQLRASLRERVQSQKPIPGSEAALRRLVEGIHSGNPPYEEMSAPMEQVIRLQLPAMQLFTQPLGAVRSIQFRGVGNGGADQYDVHREHGTSRWQILLSSDSRIASASIDWYRASDATCQ